MLTSLKFNNCLAFNNNSIKMSLRAVESLLLGYDNELKNRYLHIDYVEEIQSAKIALWRSWQF